MRGKSDAQLDAEAARGPVEPRIVNHRLLYQASLHVPRLAVRQPPTTFDYSTLEWHVEDGARSGMPMSGPMLRRISESPGSMFPWPTAFGRLRYHCRLRHYTHRAADRPYWRGHLCWEAVRLTVIGGERGVPLRGPLSRDQAADVLRLDEIDPLLHNAFDDIEREMVRILRRVEVRDRDNEGRGPGAIPLPEFTHHVPSKEHIEECPNPVCRARRAAA